MPLIVSYYGRIRSNGQYWNDPVLPDGAVDYTGGASVKLLLPLAARGLKKGSGALRTGPLQNLEAFKSPSLSLY